MRNLLPALLVPAVVLALSLVLPACASAGGAAGDPLEPLLGRWTLVALEGEPLAPLPGGRAPDMEVAEDGRIGGLAGVNRYSGRLDLRRLEDGGFDPGMVVTTLMAGPEEAMEVERRFLGALERADRFELSGDELALTRAGEPLARLERVR